MDDTQSRRELPSSPRCAYRNMGWCSAKSWDRGGTEQDFCSAHPRRTKSTNKTQNVVRSQVSTYSFQTEAPINPKTLSKLALSTVKGRPCPARLPGAVAARSRCSSPAPQPSLTYVQILSQAALTHPHHAAMRHRAGRPAKTII